LVTSPNDLLPATQILISRVGASHECLDLNVGDGMLVKALAEATGRDSSKVKEDYKKAGDLGLVASQTRSRQSTIFGSVHGTLKDGTIAKLEDKPLTIAHVYQSMRSVATVSGKDSTKVRRDIIKQLLQAARGEESKFIIRIFQGKLRVGLAEASVITSIAAAVTLSPTKVLKKRGAKVPKPEEAKALSNKAADCLKTALAQVPDYETCLGAFLNFPCEQVPDICSIRTGVPVKPMLAMPSKGVTEVLQKFENQTFTCEYKYDGERGQVHLMPDGTVKIFSRNMEDNTEKYPDLQKVVPLAIDESIATCILDCEIVAYDREQERILPFQVLSTRARKNVEEKDVKVQVCLFVFDVLFFNGSSTVDLPLTDRRDIIQKFVTEVDVRVRHVTYKDTNDPEEMQAFLVQAVEDYCEVMVAANCEHIHALPIVMASIEKLTCPGCTLCMPTTIGVQTFDNTSPIDLAG
jgi:DNA ligase-1